MSRKNQNYSNEHNMQDGYYDFQGGYISYNPSELTEYYTVKGFEGRTKKPQTTKSRWC